MEIALVVFADDDDPQQPAAADATGPLLAAVQPVTDPCRSDWFTPKSVEQVRALRSGDEAFRSWTDLDYLADGAFANHGPVLVTLQGLHADRSVTITDIAVEVIARNPPPQGTVLDAPCADTELYRYAVIDLDKPQPKAVGEPVSADAAEQARLKGWRVDPISFPYEITSTDAETFLLSARTASCDCSFVVHFEWSAAGQTGRLTVPDNGKSFRVVGGANAPRCRTDQVLECR
ncbi:hypothetical protein AB0M48_36205 [Lentzea sp. NPDC051208]|uniref:hypothetical protein n=1 Tax=Lentzea sp. NPDC051208 TaxID=3154642 RepID=UPI003416DA9F